MKTHTPHPKTKKFSDSNESKHPSSKKPILRAFFLDDSPGKNYYYFEFLSSFKDLKEAIDTTFDDLMNVTSVHDQSELKQAKRTILDKVSHHRNTLYRHAQYFKKIQKNLTKE